MNKLISMVNFVLQQDITDIKQRDSIVKYANFLKQPLNLGMFVPCDEEDKVLFEEIPISQAKWLVKSFSTIESLSDISNTITPIYLNNNAIKQIGL